MQVEQTTGGQHGRNDSHCLLRVVAAVSKRISSRGKQLSAPKCFVDLGRRRSMKNPIDCNHDNESHNESNHGRRDNENQCLDPTFGFQQTAEPPIGRDRRAAVSANQRMRA